MRIIERFDIYMKNNNLNDNQVTVSCSLSTGLLGKARKGESDLGRKAIEKILSFYQDLNKTWLLTGEGEMLNNRVDISTPDISTPEIMDKDGYCMVPVYNFDAVGGMQTSNSITDSPAFIEKYVPFEGAKSGDICVKVSGNSMIPTYSPGTLLLVRKVEGWREYFGYNHVFVLFLKDGRRILKEVRKFQQNPLEYVVCASHNKDFEEEELPKSFIRDVYKVVIAQTYEGF